MRSPDRSFSRRVLRYDSAPPLRRDSDKDSGLVLPSQTRVGKNCKSDGPAGYSRPVPRSARLALQGQRRSRGGTFPQIHYQFFLPLPNIFNRYDCELGLVVIWRQAPFLDTLSLFKDSQCAKKRRLVLNIKLTEFAFLLIRPRNWSAVTRRFWLIRSLRAGSQSATTK